MTKEKIKKFLNDTKVYVNGKSKEIQKKLFSFGYYWGGRIQEVSNPSMPFLFIRDDRSITYTNDMEYFSNHKFREITAEEILSLEITEPSYRPFKTPEECWEEMRKHPNVGWVKFKRNSHFYHIDAVGTDVSIDNSYISYQYCLSQFEFTDGAPFGIKEEN